MDRIPLPPYALLEAMARDEEALNRFIFGLVLNPPRQSWYSNWRTRKLRRALLEDLEVREKARRSAAEEEA